MPPESNSTTLPSTGTTNYTASTPPALSNPVPLGQSSSQATTIETQPAVAQPAAAPTQAPTGNEQNVDFSQFESARGDIPSSSKTTTPQSQTAVVTPPAGTTAQTVTQQSPTTQQTTQQTSTAPASTTSQTQTTKSLVDDKGVPIPVAADAIDLSQSAFTTTPATQQSGAAQQTTQTTQQTNLPTHVDGRDFTGMDERERAWFKQMSNDAYNALRPQYMEFKQAKTQLTTLQNEKQQLEQQLNTRTLDPNTAVNPLGYVFTPEFQQIVQGRDNASFEQNYWKQQLAELRSGKKPRILQHNGQQYIQGPEMEPDANSEATIMSNMQQANNVLLQYNNAEQQLQRGFQGQVAQEIATIRATEDRYFPWFADGKQHPYKPVIDGFISQIPPSQRNSPLARPLGKAWAFIQHLLGENTRLKGTAAAPATTVQNPTGLTTTPQQVTNGNEVTMDAFEQVKQRY